MGVNIKSKILKHLNGLNNLEKQSDSEKLIDVIAQRYDAPKEIVRQVIAEWSAGRKN